MSETGLWFRVISPDIRIDQVKLEFYREDSDSDQPVASLYAPEASLDYPQKFLEITAADGKNQMWILIFTPPDKLGPVRIEATGKLYGAGVAHGHLSRIYFIKNKINDYRDPIELTQTGNDWQTELPSRGEWHIGRAGTKGDVGEYSSISIDSAGHMHISHYDNFFESLKYTTNANGAWETLTLVKNLTRGTVFCTSLAIDPNGCTHISYHDQPNLKYATNVSGEWRFRSITDGGKENAIAVDKNGHIHIAFTREHELFYLTNSSGQWMYRSIDSGHVGCLTAGMLGRHIAIAIDHTNHAHISYYDHGGKNLRYATNKSGSWCKSTLISEGDVGSYNTIAIDASGHVHICCHVYHSDHIGYLCYITNASGNWEDTVIDSSAGEPESWRVGVYAAIGVDTAGHAHIAYQWRNPANGFGFLSYATNRGGGWQITRLDESGRTTGKNAAIAVDSSNYLYVAYRWREEPCGSELRYATTAPEHRLISVVEDEGDVGKYSAVVIDSEGRPHISYYNETNGDLKYASLSGEDEQWTNEIVDRLGRVGHYTSIIVTASGRICISYIDTSNHTLKFASRGAGDPWEIHTIDSGAVADSNTSMAMDNSGRLHISYTGLQANNYASLKYATRIAGASEWEIHTLDSEAFVGQRSAISVDPFDRIHISYLGQGTLKYATRAPDAEIWEIETICQGASGRSTSIGVEENGRAHICFYRYDDRIGSLMHTTRGADEEQWATTFLKYGGIVGEYNSITVEKNGRIHISYNDHQHGDLKYCSYQSGLWSAATQTLDSAGRVGAHNCIAVDRLGHVVISYYEETNRNLKCVRPLLSGLQSFAAHDNPEYFIRHRYKVGELTTVDSDLDCADATFRLIPGLADDSHGYVSFEASNYPAHFLRHQYMGLKLHEFDTEKLYRMDATFRVVRGLADSQSVSFESYNYPGHYICYNSREGTVELKIESRKVLIEEDRTKDATFLIAHPLHES